MTSDLIKFYIENFKELNADNKSELFAQIYEDLFNIKYEIKLNTRYIYSYEINNNIIKLNCLYNPGNTCDSLIVCDINKFREMMFFDKDDLDEDDLPDILYFTEFNKITISKVLYDEILTEIKKLNYLNNN